MKKSQKKWSNWLIKKRCFIAMLHEELQTSLEFLGPVEVIKFNCKVAIIHFLGVPSLSTS